jgi:hypothetical protein
MDYLRPIIADADTGHGGITANMKLAKMFVEKGASGIHLEDQSLKCILEPKEVNNALMEQAGELIRRERLEKLAKEDDLPSLLNEDDGSTSGDGSALRDRSV